MKARAVGGIGLLTWDPAVWVVGKCLVSTTTDVTMAFVVWPNNALTQVTNGSWIDEAAQECARARQSSCKNESNDVMLVVQGLQVPEVSAPLEPLTCQDGVSRSEETRMETSKLAASTLHMLVAHSSSFPCHIHTFSVLSSAGRRPISMVAMFSSTRHTCITFEHGVCSLTSTHNARPKTR